MTNEYHYDHFKSIWAIFYLKGDSAVIGLEYREGESVLASQITETFRFLERNNLNPLPQTVTTSNGVAIPMEEPPRLGVYNRKEADNQFNVFTMWAEHRDEDALTMGLYLPPNDLASVNNYFVKRVTKNNRGYRKVYEYEETLFDDYLQLNSISTDRLKDARAVETPKGFITLGELFTTDDPDLKEFCRVWTQVHEVPNKMVKVLST